MIPNGPMHNKINVKQTTVLFRREAGDTKRTCDEPVDDHDAERSHARQVDDGERDTHHVDPPEGDVVDAVLLDGVHDEAVAVEDADARHEDGKCDEYAVDDGRRAVA